MEQKSRVNFNLLALICAVLAILLAGASFTLSLISTLSGSHPTITYSGGVDGNSANFVEGSIADVANKVSPAVVSVLTETRSQSWFGQAQTSTAAGTGFIISSNGYILTNKHVVNGARSISVVLDDGTTYTDVKVVGIDPLNDVAVIQIPDVQDLPAVELGESKTINVGQQVIAIGNALGQYSNTVTEGIISGTNRTIQAATDSYGTDIETLTDMIQTDASINQGNSGGPLVNAAGQVIGINTAVSTSAENIGFAIPISSGKGIIRGVLETGEFERAYLGVRYVMITAEVAKEYNLPVSEGAYLHSEASSTIIKNGPAAKAGLKDGDIIVAINGVKVGKNGSVSSLIGEYLSGETIQIIILRDGEEHTIEATLEAYPDLS